jgi:ubiquinone/menaquinone biosynthesis C-methylase UbiE
MRGKKAQKRSDERKAHVCPPWLSWLLINPIRSLSQNPRKILQRFIREGDTVLDAGCGPGYFTTVMAELVGENGLVIAADIQEWMLENVRKRVERAGLPGRVRLHLAQADRLNVPSDHVDFALAFWMAHEVPDKGRLFTEILGCLKPGGTLLLAEPKIHINENNFHGIVEAAGKAGFMMAGPVPVRLSRAVIFYKPGNP